MATNAADIKFDENGNMIFPSQQQPAEQPITEIQTKIEPDQALDSLLDENFYKTAQSYYAWAEKDETFLSMSHEDILEKFYNDRAWGNNNTLGMGEDLINIKKADSQRIKEFALIQSTYDALPSFWNDPNRSFGDWLIDNGGAVLADPINLVGVGIGGQAAKQAYKQSLTAALKNKIAKDVSADLIEEVAKTGTNQAMKAAIKKGAIREGQIGAGAAVLHDGLLQSTRIEADMQDEFSLKRSAMSGAAGFGLGTVFGGLFSAGAFKVSMRGSKNKSLKQLEDLQNYGRDEITGDRLFNDLYVKKETPELYKNMTDEEINNISRRFGVNGRTMNKQIQNLRNVQGQGKPPDKNFNYDKFRDKEKGSNFVAKYIESRGEQINWDKRSFADVEAAASQLGLDPKELVRKAKSTSKDVRKLPETVLALSDSIAANSYKLREIATIFTDQKKTLNPDQKQKLIAEFYGYQDIVDNHLIVAKDLQYSAALTTAVGRIRPDKRRAAELLSSPENPKYAKLKQENPEEFLEAIAKLPDDSQIILALQNAKKVDGWALAAEYVNNNLLSSPDTHLLNILSGLTQTQWKPFVMLLKSANMGIRGQEGAARTAREALETYVYTITSIKTALQRAGRSIIEGRPLLDSQQMKVDNNIRQGQLQSFINSIGETLTEPMGIVGKAIQKGIVNPVAFGATFPLRVLSAGDELLKQMMFRGRMTAQINSRIFEGTSNTKQLMNKLDVFSDKTAYKKRFKELEAEYIDENGAAKDRTEFSKNLDQLYSDPLHYAREGSYTQPAYTTNPETGELEGGLTGEILSTAQKHKWLRVAGLHFINTPSNLLRFTMQHTPILGRYQLQMRHMLKKSADGKYLNPEAAMEAQARLNTGWLIWSAAVFAAMSGKITHGGSRDYRENRERENTTGWQPYALKKEDGTYIDLNRLDPIMMPFMIAADLLHAVDMWEQTGKGMPQEVENQWTEASIGVVQALVRNLTSKFYTTNIIETADAILGGNMAMSRDPEQAGARELSKFVYKAVPLSGGLRYLNRVQDPVQREIFEFTDRLNRLNPTGDNTGIMPRRNMFGEVVKKQNGWMFGLGGEDGIISSPFAQTKLSDEAVKMFLADRDTFDYTAPSKKEPKTKIDLRTLKDENGQTAYDYMIEQKQNAEFNYKGKKLKLLDYLNTMVSDKNSKLYKFPKGLNSNGKDVRQAFILQVINFSEKYAYHKMWQKFPVIEQTLKENNTFDKDLFTKQQESFLQQEQTYIKPNKEQYEFLESLLDD